MEPQLELESTVELEESLYQKWKHRKEWLNLRLCLCLKKDRKESNLSFKLALNLEKDNECLALKVKVKFGVEMEDGMTIGDAIEDWVDEALTNEVGFGLRNGIEIGRIENLADDQDGGEDDREGDTDGEDQREI
jgi:hypothetical protein